MLEFIKVNNNKFRVLTLLGKGKGGYSYLVENEKGDKFVLKQIHHEPCDYYTFGNKMESELRDYETLSKIGIKMPKMIDFDIEKERILKEFIDGDTIAQMVEKGESVGDFIPQVLSMCNLLYPIGLNIDYYPTNFVVQDRILYYIDYECNSYSDKWNFENWGAQYWSKNGET